MPEYDAIYLAGLEDKREKIIECSRVTGFDIDLIVNFITVMSEKEILKTKDMFDRMNAGVERYLKKKKKYNSKHAKNSPQITQYEKKIDRV